MTEVRRVRLKDGREMTVRMAGVADAEAVAAEHPLPRTGDMPERLLRNYYLSKALLYVRAPVAGITTGWVDGRLAGFIFHCTDLAALRRFARSPGMVTWMVGQAVSGRFGHSPGFWLGCLRWAAQHFRQPGRYGPDSPVPAEYAEIPGWVGTVHTVDDFRRLGVATHLLNATEEHLRGLGQERVALWAASDNVPAQLLYQRQGYRSVGEFHRVGETCLLMVKSLRVGAEGGPAPTVAPRARGPGRAVVTDAAERIGLHVIRALGRAGIEVVATEIVDRTRICPGFRSRYAHECHLLPSWDRPEPQWVDKLMEVGREGDVLFPVCYNSLARAVRNWDMLGQTYRALLPEWEALQTANDKWRLYEFASTLGVRMPESLRPEDEHGAGALAERINYPAIVKLCSDQNLCLRPSQRYERVGTPEALMAAWRRFHELQPHPIVQDYIPGEGYGFEALYDTEGRAVATFQHRRLVECPPEGGPSALCESVCIDELEEIGRRLLDGLSWRGVAMVEFRRCADTGEFYLLEINPRFWGSLPLSEAAGVNFPALYYRCARGEPITVPDCRAGVRTRLLPTYLISTAMSMGRGGRGFLRGCRQLGALLNPWVSEGLMTLDDPRGSLAYVRRSLGVVGRSIVVEGHTFREVSHRQPRLRIIGPPLHPLACIVRSLLRLCRLNKSVEEVGVWEDSCAMHAAQLQGLPVLPLPHQGVCHGRCRRDLRPIESQSCIPRLNGFLKRPAREL